MQEISRIAIFFVKYGFDRLSKTELEDLIEIHNQSDSALSISVFRDKASDEMGHKKPKRNKGKV